MEVVIKTILSLIVLASLTLAIGCGKDNQGNMVNLDQPTVVTKAPRAELAIETCESLQGYLLCNCLDRIAYKQCERFMAHADNSYTECLAPFLEAAYTNYCSVNRNNAYTDRYGWNLQR